MKLKAVLKQHSITQAELAAGISRSGGFISQLISGDSGASQETIESLLSFLSERLGRRVTYEELFGAPTEGLAESSDVVPAGGKQ